MIKITDIGGSVKYLNADLIEKIELVPDTMIMLVNGSRYIVREPPEEIIQRITEFRRGIACRMEKQLPFTVVKPSEPEGAAARGEPHASPEAGDTFV